MTDDRTPKTGASDSPSRGEAEGTVDRQENAEESDHQANSDVAPERDESTNHENDGPDRTEQDYANLGAENAVSRTERFAFWTLVATAALAVATLVLAIATVDLAFLARQQAHDTQTALAVADRQAKAAEEANKLSRSPLVAMIGQTISAVNEGSELSGSIKAVNTGHSPAFHVAGQAILLISEVPPTSQLATLPASNQGGAVLFPSLGIADEQNLQFDNNIEAQKITKEVVEKIRLKQLFVYLFSRLDYNDSDGRRHFITNCAYLKSDVNKVGPCVYGNDSQ